MAQLRTVVPGILHHHERFDGLGYPDRLAADAIPLAARIIAVADTYDAMTSNRSYREGLGHWDAVAEIRKHAGTQFDPDVVQVFLARVAPSLEVDMDQWAERVAASTPLSDGPGAQRREVVLGGAAS